MKRLIVLATLIFTFAFAPQIPTLRSASAEPAHADPGPDILKILESLEKKDEAPEVVCASSSTSDKCVPQYRLNGVIEEGLVNRAVAWIAAANTAGADEILLEINTPGGSVSDGFELSKAIEESKAPVTCVVDMDAESMGFYILQSCDYRMMTKRSKLMAHEPALGGMFHGQPSQWQAIANMMKAEAEAMAEHCIHRTKISLKEYHEKTDGSQMWFFNHTEALKRGVIDCVAASVKSVHDQMLHRDAAAYKQP